MKKLEINKLTAFNFKFIILTFTSLLISYLFVLDNNFIGDDVARIRNSEELKSLKSALTGELGDRPLLMLFMWVQHLFFKLNPIGYRIIGLFIHTLASFQLYQLIKDLNSTKEEDKNFFAAVVAFIFALHPLHSQALNVIIQQSVMLAGLLGILSFRYFLKYLEAPSLSHFGVSVLTLGLAILAKPIVSFLPFFYLLYGFVLSPERRRQLFALVPHFLLLALPPLFYLVWQKNAQNQPLNGFTYFLVQTEVLFTYFKLMVFPYGLKYLYDFYAPESLVSINLLYLTAHLAIILLANKILRNKKLYLLFIGIYLAFLPESGFFPILHLAFEHRTYLPLAFFAIFIASLGMEYEWHQKKTLKQIVVGLSICFFILNQTRNFQIKPSTNWMLHSLENSISHHNFNFAYTGYLMFQGVTDELTPIIKKYKEIYPGVPLYEMLQDLHLYQTQEANRDEILERLFKSVQLFYDGAEVRKDINIFVATRIIKPDSGIEDYIKVEKMLAEQMIIMHKDPKVFKKVLEIYKRTATELLSPKYASAYAKLDKVNYLKTKAILTHYFGVKHEGLAQEIQSELKKVPTNQVLQRLAELTQDK